MWWQSPSCTCTPVGWNQVNQGRAQNDLPVQVWIGIKWIRTDPGGAEPLQFEAESALVALSGIWPRAEQRQPQNFHFSPNCSRLRQIRRSRLSPSRRLLDFCSYKRQIEEFNPRRRCSGFGPSVGNALNTLEGKTVLQPRKIHASGTRASCKSWFCSFSFVRWD